jgi:MSHA biogenesis protein MshE
MPGIVQVQTNEKIGLDFARVLRSFLRQDPDVIFIGEIRDHETAEIASRAAMTGHLVLSTLHTNDAISTPGRLVDMGIPPYLIASTLLAVVSQRLVRLSCKHCAAPYQPDEDEVQWLLQGLGVDTLPERAQLKRGCGCPRCNNIGYQGRTGVHEILTISPPLARALRGGTLQEFETAAQEAMTGATIAHRVLQLVLDGRTTVAEAMKVVNWDDS